MFANISPALALLFIQAISLPANTTLPNFVIPEFVPVPSGKNYQLCTQGCLPAALLCAAPVVPPPPLKACNAVSFTSPLLEWYTHRDFGAISFGCNATVAQPDCWSCCININPLFE